MPYTEWFPSGTPIYAQNMGICVTTGTVTFETEDEGDPEPFQAAYNLTRASAFDSISNQVWDGLDDHEPWLTVAGSVTWGCDFGRRYATGHKTQVLMAIGFDHSLSNWNYSYPVSDKYTQWSYPDPVSFNRWLGFTGLASISHPAQLWTHRDQNHTPWTAGQGTVRVAMLDWGTYHELTNVGAPATWIPDGSGTTIATGTVTSAMSGSDVIPYTFMSSAEFAALTDETYMLLFAEYLMPEPTGLQPVPPFTEGPSSAADHYYTNPLGIDRPPWVEGIVDGRFYRYYDPMVRTVGGKWKELPNPAGFVGIKSLTPVGTYPQMWWEVTQYPRYP